MSKVAKRKTKDGRVLPDGVSERKDGRFVYRYIFNGKPHYKYDRDLTSLKKKIAQLQLDITTGRNLDLAGMSLRDWYPQYVKIFKEGKVKETTLLNLNNYFKWYVQDYEIAKVPMRDLKRTNFIAHFKYLADEKKLARGTLRSLASMLYNCLQQVIYDGGLYVNPASEIMKDIVAKPKEVRDALTDEQIKLLLDFLKIEGTFQNVHLPMIGILLGTGIRYGECAGLTWNDIDFEKKVVRINHSMHYRCKNDKEGHKYFITSPKTINAYRDIPLSDDMMSLLEIQKKYQKKMKIRQDVEIDGRRGFIFTSRLGYPYTHEGAVASIRRIVKRANEWEEEKAKLENRKPVVLPEKLTPHVFRHTFATKLVLADVPYETTKIVMGHSSIKTTMDIYAHIKHDNKKSMRADIGNVVNIF